MRIINKKYLLIILLVGVVLTGVIILKPTKEVKLDNVILKQEVNNKTFAMYTETNNGYEEYEGNKFPDMYVLNLSESKCIDNNGNKLEGVLSYENNEVTITSGNTTYCYLYFDKSLGLEIKENNPQGLSVDIKGAMYRFQGPAKDSEGKELVNNYICFGTSEKDACIKDPDHHMYRIIGIEAETGRVKVIKKEVLDDQIAWTDNYNDDIEFPRSKIFEALNEDKFLKNISYVPTDWNAKISDNTWLYGDMLYNGPLGETSQTGKELYLIETGQKETKWYNYATEDTTGALSRLITDENSGYIGKTIYYTNGSGYWAKTFESKVSLMYLHDYYYSVSDEANCESDLNCKSGWIHLSQNDKNALNGIEWTMTRQGWRIVLGYFDGLIVADNGNVRTSGLLNNLFIRPVFYIDASQTLKDGIGTIDDPFIIN